MVMNPSLVLFVASGVLFGLLPIVFRSSAVAVFLTLCAGSIASKLVAQDITQVINSVINFNVPMFSIVQIAIIVIGPVVLLFGLKGSVKPAGLLWQLVPAVASAVLAVMFITVALPYDMQKTIQESQLYGYAQPYFALAAAAGLLASVLHLWALKPKKHHEKHGKKHKK